MSVRMNFGNLKYAIGSSRAMKLSKRDGPSISNESTSTINLNTKSNVENLISKKNNQIKPKNEKSEKILESNLASIKAIPVATKTTKTISKIQFVTQTDRLKVKETINLNSNSSLNSPYVSNSHRNSNSLTRKPAESRTNSAKHQKTSSEIPNSINMASNIYSNANEDYNSNLNLRENSIPKREVSIRNMTMNMNVASSNDRKNIINRNKYIVGTANDSYNNSSNNFNLERENSYENAELDLKLNIINANKIHRNVFKSVERKNDNFSFKVLNSERKENTKFIRNISTKTEDDRMIMEKSNKNNKESYRKNLYDEKNYDDYNSNTKMINLTDSNFNFNEQIVMNKELIKTVEIFKTYIKTIQNVAENKKKEFERNLKIKDEDLKKLKDENHAIKKQNTELKMKMLQFLNQVKLYENREIDRGKVVNKYVAQILLENDYLRCSNETVIGILNSTYTSNKNNNQDKNEKDKILKITHKRQRTHINFTNPTTQANSEIDLSKDQKDKEKLSSSNFSSIGNDIHNSFNSNKSDEMSVISTVENYKSNSSTASILAKKEENDDLSLTLKEMQTIQSDKKEASEEKKNEAALPPMFIMSPTGLNQKHKPSYLFYRTPGNKDNKKIDYYK